MTNFAHNWHLLLFVLHQVHSFASSISQIDRLYLALDLCLTILLLAFKFAGRSISSAIAAGSALAFTSAVLDIGGRTTRTNNGKEYYPYTTGKRPNMSWFRDRLSQKEALGGSCSMLMRLPQVACWFFIPCCNFCLFFRYLGSQNKRWPFFWFGIQVTFTVPERGASVSYINCKTARVLFASLGHFTSAHFSCWEIWWRFLEVGLIVFVWLNWGKGLMV